MNLLMRDTRMKAKTRLHELWPMNKWHKKNFFAIRIAKSHNEHSQAKKIMVLKHNPLYRKKLKMYQHTQTTKFSIQQIS